MLQQIKKAIFILSFVVILLGIGIYHSARFSKIMSRGNYFFEETRDNIKIKTIILEFPQNQTITIEKKNDLWYIGEADDYFASFAQLNSLFRLLRQTTIYRADVIDEKKLSEIEKNSFILKTLDDKGKIVDQAFIQPKHKGMRFNYATLNNNHLLYQIKGNFELSHNPMDWIQAPILNIADRAIKSVRSSRFHVYRRFSAENLKDINTDKTVHIEQLLSNLWYLSAIDVKHAVHFNRTQYQKSQNYEITTFGGLIYLIDIFTDGTDFWLNIKMEHEPTVSAEDMRLYKENHTLYEGWFFKINPEIGALINGFKL